MAPDTALELWFPTSLLPASMVRFGQVAATSQFYVRAAAQRPPPPARNLANVQLHPAMALHISTGHGRARGCLNV